MELSKKGKISETNLSGVTYTMEELVNWGETYSGQITTIFTNRMA